MAPVWIASMSGSGLNINLNDYFKVLVSESIKGKRKSLIGLQNKQKCFNLITRNTILKNENPVEVIKIMNVIYNFLKSKC